MITWFWQQAGGVSESRQQAHLNNLIKFLMAFYRKKYRQHPNTVKSESGYKKANTTRLS